MRHSLVTVPAWRLLRVAAPMAKSAPSGRLRGAIKTSFRLLSLSIICGLILVGSSNGARAQPLAKETYPHTRVLYQAGSGKLPSSAQLSLVSLGAMRAAQTYRKGVTILDTTANIAGIAGYVANAGVGSSMTLNRTQGFELAFNIQILAETHRGADRNRDGIADRAGFSVLILGEDARGIELGFWPNSIWAQADGNWPAGQSLLTHAESATLSTQRMLHYRLQIKGDVYTLWVEDQPVLTGPVRDYAAFEGFPDVYAVPDLIFMGDNSGSGQARVAIQEIRVGY